MSQKNDSDNEEQISLPSLRRKEESVYDAWERMKKRHAKSLHKQTFEEQLLTEFRQFSNGVMPRLDKQNQILAQLISIQKSSHTSFPAVQNINVKQERFEMNYDNGQCEIVEHQIDKPELFHDPYPYERFETDQLPNLERESLKFYKEQLKFAENDKPLAYYFFELEIYLKMLKQELDQYTNNIKKSTHHLYWTTSKTTSQILISQIAWQAQVCLKTGKEWKD